MTVAEPHVAASSEVWSRGILANNPSLTTAYSAKAPVSGHPTLAPWTRLEIASPTWTEEVPAEPISVMKPEQLQPTVSPPRGNKSMCFQSAGRRLVSVELYAKVTTVNASTYWDSVQLP